jgi:two-component system phosphate regulon sensor histidine kinase PhoR
VDHDPPFELLDYLAHAALVQAVDDGRVIYINPALATLKKAPLASKSSQANPSHASSLGGITDYLSLPEKVACPACRGAGDTGLATHIAFLRTTPNKEGQQPEEIRVKVKHSRLPSGHILSFIDPFSEDVTLTQAHSDFVSTVSHEFRTPLTSIKGFADTLLRYGASLPPEQQKRFISIIKDQADRLTRLVENLLTVSKLGAARVELTYRPIALGKMVDKVIQNIKGKGEFDRLFELDIPKTLPEVWADPDKLEQVLLNLIDNAVKYSFAGSRVAVRARLDNEASDAEDWLRVTISDQGVGIPTEHLPKIFSKFSRIDNPLTRQVEGTGLGLYITKSLTMAMGGQIKVESTTDPEATYRTTFVLRLPTASPERQAAFHLHETDSDAGTLAT